MGRGLAEDPLFFGAALAGGVALGELAAEVRGAEGDQARAPERGGEVPGDELGEQAGSDGGSEAA
jgi:hypothetical protein